MPTAQRINLGGPEQEAYGLQQGITSGLLGLGTERVGQFDRDQFSLDDLPSGDRVSNALFERKMNLVRPQLDEAKNNLDVSLQERGIPIGSEIYNREMDRFDRTRNQTLEALSQDAILAGGAEEDRLMNRELTARNQGFNELAAILQGSPALNTPQFQSQPAYQISAPDVAGLTMADYNNRLNAYNQQQSIFMADCSG